VLQRIALGEAHDVCLGTVLGHRIIRDVGKGWGLLLFVSVVDKVLHLTALAELRSACWLYLCASGEPVQMSRAVVAARLIVVGQLE
jgi:hypothetical protein